MKRSTMIILSGFMIILISVLMNYQNITQSTVNSDEQNYTYHFVFIGRDANNPLWATIREGVEDAADSYKVAVEYYFSNEETPDDEIDYLRMSVNARVDGIVINGYEEEAVREITSRAWELDIPVVFINDESHTGVRTSYIGVNNYEAGRRAIRELEKHRQGELKIGILLDAQKNAQESIRFQSMIEEIRKNEFMEFAIEESAKDARADVYNAVKSMLVDNPEINAIIGTRSYHGGVIGEVLVDLGIVGDILVIGFDDLDDTMRYIDKDVIAATLDIDTYNMGYYSIRSLVKYKDNQFVDDVYYMPIKVIDQSNIDDYRKEKRYE